MVNLNKDLYKEISKIVKTNEIEYPTIKNFVEKAVLNEIKNIESKENMKKQEKEYMKKAKHLFSLVAQKKFNEIEKLFPGSQKKR